MPALAIRLAGALLILPLLAHFAFVMHLGLALVPLLVAVQAAVVTWIASSWRVWRWLRVGCCGVAFLAVLLLARLTEAGPLIAAAVPHAMANLALLALFAASLQPRREAIATVFARKARGPLPPDIVRYTRRVTWAWCWFFAAQLAASLLLWLFASPDTWSLFINLCNMPLIGVMLAAEYLYRQWHHAAQPPERLHDMIRIFRQIRAASVGEQR